MRKTEVYSWRLSPATKTALENEARREGTTVSGLLHRITHEWVSARARVMGNAAEQARLHARVRKTLGTISAGDPRRAKRARIAIRARVNRRHGR